MATLVLTAAVGALGLTGFPAIAAGLAASAVGGFIDSRLFATDTKQEGPRLNEISFTTSAESSSIRRVYGRARVGGNLIWTSNFTETVQTDTQEVGKGGGGSTVTTTTYSYSISFAMAFCEGNSRVTLGRVWADGKLLDTESLNIVFYSGDETQGPDPTIEGVEGTGNVPGYRGIAYMVFKDLPLEQFGNRIPQINVEIIKPLPQPEVDSTEALLTGVNLIPSTGEAAYATTPSIRDDGFGNAVPENVNLSATQSNLDNSMDNLGKMLPNVNKINLVIAWFGTDLRASNCEFRPQVESKTGRTILPTDWSVSGQTRTDPNITAVSVDNLGNPVFGGTPADFSVVEAIQRIGGVDGNEVFFYPFLLMDIPPGNTLPNTVDGTPGQPIYPWRGRITTSLPSVDTTATAQTEVNSLFGSVAASDFSVSGTNVTYTGSATDFGYRRMILHYAHLCAAAANTLADPTKFSAFYIGTELRGITRIRSTASGTATGSTVYPGVLALLTLFQDVRNIFDAAGLTGVKLSYAADWSEYHSHRPSDGSNDVYFNMDAIWGSSLCNYVAIDNYMKLSDWRDGNNHEDYGTGTVTAYATTGTFGSAGFPQGTSIFDDAYLRGQIEGGEDYDYFYASDADRDSQTRTQIIDGLHQEHWIYRQKDLRNWWGQTHRSRPGGVRDGSVVSLGGTSNTWGAGGSPVYFSECGSPAVDKGTNQPNVFFDPKSSESFLPYFSSGQRDDVILRSYYENLITYWRDNTPVGMIDVANVFAWTWDVRPYPAFPFRNDIWSDAANYRLGHWLNGRVGLLTLGQLVKLLCGLAGIPETDVDVTGLTNANSIVRGLVIDNIMTVRDMLNPLMTAYLFDAFESEGKIKFVLKSNTLFQSVTTDELVTTQDDIGGYQLTRAQEVELPVSSSINFIDEENNYQPASVGGLRTVGAGNEVIDLRFPLVLDQDYAQSLSEIYIHDAWVARDKAEFRLPPSRLALDPGDGVSITLGNRNFNLRLNAIERGGWLSMTAATHDISIYETISFDGRANTIANIPVFGRSNLLIMDIPLTSGEEPLHWAPRVAAYQKPFPSSVDLYRTTDGTNTLNQQLTLPALMGETLTTLAAGQPFGLDGVNTVNVKLYNTEDSLLSITLTQLLNGGNVAVVRNTAGNWEVFQFQNAVLAGQDNGLPVYTLSNLLRGQLGTETEIDTLLPVASKFVLLTGNSIFPVDLSLSQKFFQFDYRYGPAGQDIASTFFQNVTHTGQAAGLLPYAPVHLKKTPTAGTNEVTFTWIRRTRFGGDDFDAEEVPLNEQSEQYDLEIYDSTGVTLRRTLTDLTTASYTYTEASQTSDGGILTSYVVKVWQKSADVGRGREASATL